ncbi:unnamed protein product [Amoebophrya sp. A120]|nr:unnamed protein product [Amoebophrya sp. A120]|eukprot:GSA120T00006293001.1
MKKTTFPPRRSTFVESLKQCNKILVCSGLLFLGNWLTLYNDRETSSVLARTKLDRKEESVSGPYGLGAPRPGITQGSPAARIEQPRPLYGQPGVVGGAGHARAQSAPAAARARTGSGSPRAPPRSPGVSPASSTRIPSAPGLAGSPHVRASLQQSELSLSRSGRREEVGRPGTVTRTQPAGRPSISHSPQESENTKLLESPKTRYPISARPSGDALSRPRPTRVSGASTPAPFSTRTTTSQGPPLPRSVSEDQHERIWLGNENQWVTRGTAPSSSTGRYGAGDLDSDGPPKDQKSLEQQLDDDDDEEPDTYVEDVRNLAHNKAKAFYSSADIYEKMNEVVRRRYWGLDIAKEVEAPLFQWIKYGEWVDPRKNKQTPSKYDANQNNAERDKILDPNDMKGRGKIFVSEVKRRVHDVKKEYLFENQKDQGKIGEHTQRFLEKMAKGFCTYLLFSLSEPRPNFYNGDERLTGAINAETLDFGGYMDEKRREFIDHENLVLPWQYAWSKAFSEDAAAGPLRKLFEGTSADDRRLSDLSKPLKFKALRYLDPPAANKKDFLGRLFARDSTTLPSESFIKVARQEIEGEDENLRLDNVKDREAPKWVAGRVVQVAVQIGNAVSRQEDKHIDRQIKDALEYEWRNLAMGLVTTALKLVAYRIDRGEAPKYEDTGVSPLKTQLQGILVYNLLQNWTRNRKVFMTALAKRNIPRTSLGAAAVEVTLKRSQEESVSLPSGVEVFKEKIHQFMEFKVTSKIWNRGRGQEVTIYERYSYGGKLALSQEDEKKDKKREDEGFSSGGLRPNEQKHSDEENYDAHPALNVIETQLTAGEYVILMVSSRMFGFGNPHLYRVMEFSSIVGGMRAYWRDGYHSFNCQSFLYFITNLIDHKNAKDDIVDRRSLSFRTGMARSFSPRGNEVFDSFDWFRFFRPAEADGSEDEEKPEKVRHMPTPLPELPRPPRSSELPRPQYFSAAGDSRLRDYGSAARQRHDSLFISA